MQLQIEQENIKRRKPYIQKCQDINLNLQTIGVEIESIIDNSKISSRSTYNFFKTVKPSAPSGLSISASPVSCHVPISTSPAISVV